MDFSNRLLKKIHVSVQGKACNVQLVDKIALEISVFPPKVDSYVYV